VTETSGNGSDTVYSSVTFVLGNNLENLVLMGNSNINAKGNSLNNNLIGNNGNNIVDGQAGNDILDGRSGNDTLIGGLGSDTFIISSGTDAIMDLGLGGDSLQVSLGATVNATIKSAWTASSDTLNEGTVNITTKGFAVNVSASTGSDGYSILNTGSASSLVGSAAGDSLKGGKGNDFIIGNAGNDFIYGGAGKDILTGGSGNDTFIFNTTPNKSSNIDTLTDFSSGVDKLQFDKAIFKSIGSTGTLNADAFYANAGATSGHDTTDRFVYNTTSGALYYDADGSGKNVAVQIALIGVASHPDLVVTDFIVA
jgi:Ca2+-binding RTX toxin-like protein